MSPSAFQGRSGQEQQNVNVPRSNDGEVPPIEGGDLSDSKSLGQGHQGCVSAAKRKIRVLHDELGHPAEVNRQQLNGAEVAFGEARQELCLDASAALPSEQISNLGHDGAGNQDLSSRKMQARQQLNAGVVMIVPVKSRSDQWPGVGKDHALATEALGQKLVDPRGYVLGPALDRPEPDGRPWTV